MPAENYADPLHVRRLSGGRTQGSISEAELEGIINRSDDIVKLWTGKRDWSEDDEEFHTVKYISELIASSSVRRGFKDEDDEANKQMEEARRLLELLVMKSKHAGAGQVVIKHRPYKSYPANPNGEIYSSTKSRFIKVGSHLDPDGVV